MATTRSLGGMMLIGIIVAYSMILITAYAMDGPAPLALAPGVGVAPAIIAAPVTPPRINPHNLRARAAPARASSSDPPPSAARRRRSPVAPPPVAPGPAALMPAIQPIAAPAPLPLQPFVADLFGAQPFNLPGPRQPLSPRAIIGSLIAGGGSHAAAAFAYPPPILPSSAVAPPAHLAVAAAQQSVVRFAPPLSNTTDDRMRAMELQMADMMQGMKLLISSRSITTSAPVVPSSPSAALSHTSPNLNLAASGYGPRFEATGREAYHGRHGSSSVAQPTAAMRERMMRFAEDSEDEDNYDHPSSRSTDREFASIRNSRDRQRLLGDPLQSVGYATDIFNRLGGGGVENLRQAVRERNWSNQRIRKEVEHQIVVLLSLVDHTGLRLDDPAIELIARRLGGMWHADITGDYSVLDAMEARPGNANASPFARGTLNYVSRGGDSNSNDWSNRQHQSSNNGHQQRPRQQQQQHQSAAAAASSTQQLQLSGWRAQGGQQDSSPARRDSSPPPRPPPAVAPIHPDLPVGANGPTQSGGGVKPRGRGPSNGSQ